MWTNLKILWRQRLQGEVKDLVKQSTYIMNDHFSIVLLVLFGFGALSYQHLLVALSAQPSAWVAPVVGLALLGVSSLGQPMWLTRPADPSYLLPQGQAWRRYWLQGACLGALSWLLVLGLLAGLVFPLLVLTSAWTWEGLLPFVLGWLFFRSMRAGQDYLGINDQEGKILASPWLYWFLVPVTYGLTLYLPAPYGPLVWLVISGGGLAGVIWQVYQTRQTPFRFDWVISQEAKRLTNQSKWLAIFVDQPHQAPQIRRRTFLDPLVESLSLFLAQGPDGYLFLRRLFRDPTYSGLWFRVTGFFGLVLLGLDAWYLQVLAGCLAAFLLLAQVLPLLQAVSSNPFQALYPNQTSPRKRLQEGRLFLVLILGSQLLTLTLCLLLSHWTWLSLGISALWLVFCLLLLYVYYPWQMERRA